MSSNTISVKTYRDKYRQKAMDKLLRKALIAEAICRVDRTGAKTIQNPYSTQGTPVVQAISGTYTIQSWTTTDDTLTVSQEVILGEHVFDFETTLTLFDLFAERVDQQNYAVAYAIDKYVLNEMVKNAGDSYPTPSGSFPTAANLPIIISNVISRFAGYSELYNGMYIVVENTDLVGIAQQQAISGFNFADMVLKNGWVNNYLGVDIYVVRSGTFQTYSAGSNSFQNQGKRLAGVKNMVTYAQPQGVKYEEKGVSGKTGMEVVTYAYIGVKVWATKNALTLAIVGTATPSPSPSASPSASLSPSSSSSSSPSPSA